MYIRGHSSQRMGDFFMEDNYLIRSKKHTKAIATILENIVAQKRASISDYYGSFINWLSLFHINEAMYENVVAQELASHGYKLFYYDNRSKGEVDFLIDDHNTISVLPVEVKSGKDYTKHSALDNFMKVPDYHVSSAMVLNDDREIKVVNNVTYAPVYNVMFLSAKEQDPEDLIF